LASTVRLDDETEAIVQALAEKRQLPVDWVMREALLQYAEREDARSSFELEAVKALADYKRDGQHLTADEVGTWLSTLGD
jgi:predicted transcriptional regulator